jgi:hypothetical protein
MQLGRSSLAIAKEAINKLVSSTVGKTNQTTYPKLIKACYNEKEIIYSEEVV